MLRHCKKTGSLLIGSDLANWSAAVLRPYKQSRSAIVVHSHEWMCC